MAADMTDRRTLVDLDAPGDTAAVHDNAAWASGLFGADKRAIDAEAAPEPTADAGDHGGRGGVDPGPSYDRQSASQHDADSRNDRAPQQGAAMPQPVDLSALMAMAALAPSAPDTDDDDSAAATPGRGWAITLGILTTVFAVLTASILVISSRDDPRPPKQNAVPLLPVGAPTATPQAGPSGNDEMIIPYTATPQGCYAGSTSPKALEETATDSAWVCVRGFGGSGGGSDGQVLKIQLGDEMTGPRFYKISELEITPGWVPKTPGGKDEWTKHRVPTLIRYVFNDSTDPRREPTVWDVDTHNAHGPVPYRGPKPVLASAITVVILATSPAPKDVPSTSPTPTGSELPGLDSSPTPSPTDTPPDPSDATFAVSLLQVKGHLP
jgi:hypothetical protein